MANPTVEEIKAMIFQLPVEELVALMAELEERVEAITIMQLAETGFQEWNDPEEDIYNTMTKPNDNNRQQVQRLDELMAIARQRFLDAGGDPRRLPSGLKGDDYMTDEEREEALTIARSLFNDEYINSYLEKKRQNQLTVNG